MIDGLFQTMEMDLTFTKFQWYIKMFALQVLMDPCCAVRQQSIICRSFIVTIIYMSETLQDTNF